MAHSVGINSGEIKVKNKCPNNHEEAKFGVSWGYKTR